MSFRGVRAPSNLDGSQHMLSVLGRFLSMDLFARAQPSGSRLRRSSGPFSGPCRHPGLCRDAPQTQAQGNSTDAGYDEIHAKEQPENVKA